MIAKVYLYFGAIGIASILAWTTALILFAAFSASRKRTKAYWIALVLASVGLLAALINSHYVFLFDVDRSSETAEGIERQRVLRQELEAVARSKAAKVRYVEDSSSDTLDLAGMSGAVQTGILAEAAANVDSKYAYRQRGKQERAVSAAVATNRALPSVSRLAQMNAPTARLLLEADYHNAHRLDRINRFFARFAWWLALFLVPWDYLTRFNRTFGHLYPLPISHASIDSVWPKRHTVWVPGAGVVRMRTYLENVVRKGENFIYFGEEDPLPEGLSLPRVSFRNWRWWPLRKVVVGAGHRPHDDSFLFESAWFHRYAIVIAGSEEARRRILPLVVLLNQRHQFRARARRTVHVVWSCAGAPPPALATLAELCRDTNFKLVVTGTEPSGVEFEETW